MDKLCLAVLQSVIIFFMTLKYLCFLSRYQYNNPDKYINLKIDKQRNFTY